MLRSRSLFSKFPKIKCSRPASISYIINHEIVSSRNLLHTSKDSCNNNGAVCYSQSLNNNTHLQNKHKLASVKQLHTNGHFSILQRVTKKNKCPDNEKLAETYNAVNKKNIIESNTQKTTFSNKHFSLSNRKVSHISRKVNFNNEIDNNLEINLKHDITSKKKKLYTTVKYKNGKRVHNNKIINIKTNNIKNYNSKKSDSNGLSLDKNNIQHNNIEINSKFQSYCTQTQIEQKELKPNNKKLSKHNELYNKYLKQDECIKNNYAQSNCFLEQQLEKRPENDIFIIKPNLKTNTRQNTITSNSDPVIQLYNRTESIGLPLKNKIKRKGNSASERIGFSTETNIDKGLTQNNNLTEEKLRNGIANNNLLSKQNNLYMEYLKQEANNSTNIVEANKFPEHGGVSGKTYPKMSSNKLKTENIKTNTKMLTNIFNNQNKKSYTDPSIVKRKSESASINCSKTNHYTESNVNKCQKTAVTCNNITNNHTKVKSLQPNVNDLKRISIAKIQTEAKKLYLQFLKDKEFESVYNSKNNKQDFNLGHKTNKVTLNKCQKNDIQNFTSKNPKNIKKTRSYSNAVKKIPSDPGIFQKSDIASTISTFMPSHLKSPRSYSITKRANSTHNVSSKVSPHNKTIDGKHVNDKASNNTFKSYRTYKTGPMDKLMQSEFNLVKNKTETVILEPLNLGKRFVRAKSSNEIKSNSIKPKDKNFPRSKSVNNFKKSKEIFSSVNKVNSGGSKPKVLKNKFEKRIEFYQVSDNEQKVSDHQKADVKQFSKVKEKYEQMDSARRAIKNNFSGDNTTEIKREHKNDDYSIEMEKKLYHNRDILSYEKNKNLEGTEEYYIDGRSKTNNVQTAKSTNKSKLNAAQTCHIELETGVNHGTSHEMNLIKNQKSKSTLKNDTVDKYIKYKQQFKCLEQSFQNVYKEEIEIDIDSNKKTKYESIEDKHELQPHSLSQTLPFKKYEKLTNEIISKMGIRKPKPKKKNLVKFTTSVCRVKNNLRNPIPFNNTKLNPKIETRSKEKPEEHSKSNTQIKGKIKQTSPEKHKEVSSIKNCKEERKFKSSVVNEEKSKDVTSTRKYNGNITKTIAENKVKPSFLVKEKQVSSVRNIKELNTPKSVQIPKISEIVKIKEGDKVEEIQQSKNFKSKEIIKNNNKTIKNETHSQLDIKKEHIKNNSDKKELDSSVVNNEIVKNLQKFKALSTTIPDIAKKLLELNKKELEDDDCRTSKKDNGENNVTEKHTEPSLKHSNDTNQPIQKPAKVTKLDAKVLIVDKTDKEENMGDTITNTNKTDFSNPSISYSNDKKEQLSSQNTFKSSLLVNKSKQNNSSSKQNITPRLKAEKILKNRVFEGRKEQNENDEYKEVKDKNNISEMSNIESEISSLKLKQNQVEKSYPEKNGKTTATEKKNLNKSNYNKKMKFNKIVKNVNALKKSQDSFLNGTKETPVSNLELNTELFMTNKQKINSKKNVIKLGKSKSYQSNIQKKTLGKSPLNTKSTFLKSKLSSKSGQDKKHVHQHQNIAFKNEIPNILSLVNYNEKSVQTFIDLQQKPLVLDKFANSITNIHPLLKASPEPSILNPPISVFKKLKYRPFKNVNVFKKQKQVYFSLINKNKMEVNNKLKYINKLSTPFTTTTAVKPPISCDIENKNSYISSQYETNTQSQLPYSEHLQVLPNNIDLEISEKEVNKELLFNKTNTNGNLLIKSKSSSSLNKNKDRKKSDTKLKDPLSINRDLNKNTKTIKITTMSLKGKKHYRLLTTSPSKRHILKNNDKEKGIHFHKTEKKDRLGTDKKINTNSQENLNLVENNLPLKSTSIKYDSVDNYFSNTSKYENSSEIKIPAENNCIKTEGSLIKNENHSYSYNANNNLSSIIVISPFKIKQEIEGTDQLQQSEEINVSKSLNSIFFLNQDLETISNKNHETNILNDIKKDDKLPIFIKNWEDYPSCKAEEKSCEMSFSNNKKQTTPLSSNKKKMEKQITPFYKDKNNFKDLTLSCTKTDNKMENAKSPLKENNNKIKILSNKKEENKIKSHLLGLHEIEDKVNFENSEQIKIDKEKSIQFMEENKKDSKILFLSQGDKKSKEVLLTNNSTFKFNKSPVAKNRMQTLVETDNGEIRGKSDIENPSFSKSEKGTEIKTSLLSTEENLGKDCIRSKNKNVKDVTPSYLVNGNSEVNNIQLFTSKDKNEVAVETSSNAHKEVKSENTHYKNLVELKTSSSKNRDNKICNETVLESKAQKQMDAKDKTHNELGISLLEKSKMKVENEVAIDKVKNKCKTALESINENTIGFKTSNSLKSQIINDKPTKNVLAQTVIDEFHNISSKQSFDLSNKSNSHPYNSTMLKKENRYSQYAMHKDFTTKSISQNKKSKLPDAIYDPKAKCEKTFFLPSNIKIVYLPKNETAEQLKPNSEKQSVDIKKTIQNISSVKSTISYPLISNKNNYKNDNYDQAGVKEKQLMPEVPTSFQDKNKLSLLKMQQSDFDTKQKFLKTETIDASLSESKLSKTPPQTEVYSHEVKSRINKLQLNNHVKHETELREKLCILNSNKVKNKTSYSKVNRNESVISISTANTNLEESIHKEILSSTADRSHSGEMPVTGVKDTDNIRSKKSSWLDTIFLHNEETIIKKKEGKGPSVVQLNQTEKNEQFISKPNEEISENNFSTIGHKFVSNPNDVNLNNDNKKKSNLKLDTINTFNQNVSGNHSLLGDTSNNKVNKQWWIDSILPKCQKNIVLKKESTLTESNKLDKSETNNVPLQFFNKHENNRLTLQQDENVQNNISSKEQVGSGVKHKQVQSESLLKCNSQILDCKTIGKQVRSSESLTSSKNCTEHTSNFNTKNVSCNSTDHPNESKQDKIKNIKSKSLLWTESIFPKYQTNISQNQDTNKESINFYSKSRSNHSVKFEEEMGKSIAKNGERESINLGSSEIESLLNFEVSNCLTLQQTENIQNYNCKLDKKAFWIETILPPYHDAEVQKTGPTLYSDHASIGSCQKINDNNMVNTKDTQILFSSALPKKSVSSVSIKQMCNSESSKSPVIQEDNNKVRDVKMINEIENNPLWIENVIPNYYNKSQKGDNSKKEDLEVQRTKSCLDVSNNSKIDHARQAKNKVTIIKSSEEICPETYDVKLKLLAKTITIEEQGENKTKHNVVVFERKIKESPLSKAMLSLNDTSSKDICKTGKEEHPCVLDEGSVLKNKDLLLFNKKPTTSPPVKQQSLLDNKIHNDLETSRQKIARPNTASDSIFFKKQRLSKNINLSDSQLPMTVEIQTKDFTEQSLGKIDVKLKNEKIGQDNTVIFESAFLVLQGQSHLPLAPEFQSKLTESANEAQIAGEIEITNQKGKINEKTVDKLNVLEYKQNITSFLKNPTVVLSTSKTQNQLFQHVIRIKTLINNCKEVNPETKIKEVNQYDDEVNKTLSTIKSKSQNKGLDRKSEINKEKKDLEGQSSRKSYSFQFMKNKKNEIDNKHIVKPTSKKLNNIIDDIKKPVNVTINDYHEKQKYLKLTPNNIKKATENIEFVKESVKMSKMLVSNEDDKNSKTFKNPEHFQNENVIKTPLIIIDKKQTSNIKSLTKEVVERFIVSEPSQSKIVHPMEKYPLENNKRSKTYYPLVIVNIKSVKLNDLPPEIQKFHVINDILNYATSNNTDLDLMEGKKEVVKQLQDDQISEELVFKQRLQSFLRGENFQKNDDFVRSLKWTWPFFASVSAVDNHVNHPNLFYRGVIECVAKFKGHPVVVEWKLLHSPKMKPILPRDAAIRLSALMGALNYDSNFNFQVTKGIIIVAYASGDPADIFVLSSRNCQMYWKMWLTHLKDFSVTHNNKSSI